MNMAMSCLILTLDDTKEAIHSYSIEVAYSSMI